MRIGFFGGTFDPPHIGHLAVALAAAQHFMLDQVLVAPVGRQPLRVDPPVATFAERMDMVSLMCAQHPGLTASALDAPRETGEANFTVDTLRRLAADAAPGTELFAIVGADALLNLRKWRDSDSLLALAEWIAVSRPGEVVGDLAGLHLTSAQRARIHLLADVEVPVSSTMVRAQLRAGKSCADWLDPEVAAYIAVRGLYGARGELCVAEIGRDAS